MLAHYGKSDVIEITTGDLQLYLLVGTEGTQCLATSAEFPFMTRTDLEEHLLTNFKFLKDQGKD